MEVESRIESVVVYARGARVRRVASVPAPLPARIRFAGLPSGVTADTVRTEVDGPAVVHAARVGRDGGAEVDHEESPQLRAARRHVALAEAEPERRGHARDLLAAAPLVAEDPSEEPPAPWSAVVAARRQLIAMRAEREVALREQLSAARRELDEAQRAYEVALEHDARAGSARGAKLHAAQKNSRHQHEPAKKDKHAAPTGAEELYRDYDAAFPRRIDERAATARAPTAPGPLLGGVAKDQVWAEESSSAMRPQASFKPPAPAPKMLAPTMGVAKSRGGGVASAIGGVLAARLR